MICGCYLSIIGSRGSLRFVLVFFFQPIDTPGYNYTSTFDENNRGHFCIMAAVSHAEEKDQFPGKAPQFQPGVGLSHDNVAQRNLTLLPTMMEQSLFYTSIRVQNPTGEEQAFTIHTEQDWPDEEQLIALLEPDFEIPGDFGEAQHVGFIRNQCPSPEDFEDAEEVVEEIVLAPGEADVYTLVGELDSEAAYIHVVQTDETGEIAGGVTVLPRHENW